MSNSGYIINIKILDVPPLWEEKELFGSYRPILPFITFSEYPSLNKNIRRIFLFDYNSAFTNKR